eukprot:TRINITY_DN28886_c0_g1_i1.p1 TRINITY_DN28886_c0_g1~~TRINITY_DN28886_c0_g1_i1.p1  ORF type:complete len:160 (-),score=18.75 TRINITY_DN28886_c0_g1_i1:234-662(-)
MIVCVGIVGAKNNPLYLRSFEDDQNQDDLKFHYIIHCALDSVDDRASVKTALASRDGSGSYLGLLYPIENLRVYGFISKTKVKYFVVENDPQVKDDLQAVFHQIHAAYVDTVCNPFYTLNTVIQSAKFDLRIANIVKQKTTT